MNIGVSDIARQDFPRYLHLASYTLFNSNLSSDVRESLIMSNTTSATASVNGIIIAYNIHPPTPIPISTTTSPSQPPPPPQWIILLNGLADPPESWSSQLPTLISAGYTVLTFSNRGISPSSCPPGPYSATLMAADTHALLTHLSISSFHLVGISMGGMLAQQFAVTYPQGILSLTLACTYAAPSPFCSRMFDLWADTAAVMGVPHVMRDVVSWCFTPSFFSDEKRREELREVDDAMRFMDMSTPAYLAQLAVIQRFDVRGEVGRLRDMRVPVMVLAGEEDILIPTELSRELHGMIPGAIWRTCKGGHGCSMEFPDDFNRAILDFIK
jgi:3-oxoadipate enol-lactonase